MNKVMRCKLQLHSVTETRTAATIAGGDDPFVKVEFGAVWEGSPEKQAASENAIFGKMTPMASFSATIRNPAVIEKLTPGKQYYVDFIEVE